MHLLDQKINPKENGENLDFIELELPQALEKRLTDIYKQENDAQLHMDHQEYTDTDS